MNPVDDVFEERLAAPQDSGAHKDPVVINQVLVSESRDDSATAVDHHVLNGAA